MNAPLGQAARFIGQRVLRKEDARLLIGRGTFVDDVVLPGLLHAAFYRSPIAHGAIRSVNLEAARQVPGVWAIYTARDFDAFNLGTLNGFPVANMSSLPVAPLAGDTVRYVGDPVALVIASSRHVAEDAASLIEGVQAAQHELDESDEALLPQIQAVAERLKSLSEFDPELKSVIDVIEPAALQLQESVYALRHYARRLDIDRLLSTIERHMCDLHSLPSATSSSITRRSLGVSRPDMTLDSSRSHFNISRPPSNT